MVALPIHSAHFLHPDCPLPTSSRAFLDDSSWHLVAYATSLVRLPDQLRPASCCAPKGPGPQADLIGAGIGNVDDSRCLLGLEIGDESSLEGLGLAHDILLVTAAG